jgi:hypothetical protein
MPKLSFVLRTLVVFLLLLPVSGVAQEAARGAAQEAARAGDDATTMNFAVMRNGDPIGTSTVRLQRNGPQTVAEVETRVQVKVAFITAYRYEQFETQQWLDGKLVALTSTTNENGTVYRVNAMRNGDKLVVEANGTVHEVAADVIPASLWNAELVRQTIALNTKNGSVMPISVVDHGKKQLELQGRKTTARHYSIKTTFPQDVWYDEEERLLKVELRGRDGSKIHYQRG